MLVGVPEEFNEGFTVDQLCSWLLHRKQMPKKDCDVIRGNHEQIAVLCYSYSTPFFFNQKRT